MKNGGQPDTVAAPSILLPIRIKRLVGDPGIEPGMGLPGGVTVRCRTLQLVARKRALVPTTPAAVKRTAPQLVSGFSK